MSNGIEYSIEILPEDIPIRGSFDSGDAQADEEQALDIERQLARGNDWAWCTVKVVATLGRFAGCDYLGACSYANEEEFKAPGGYYEQMCEEAARDLLSTLRLAVDAAQAAKTGIALVERALAMLQTQNNSGSP